MKYTWVFLLFWTSQCNKQTTNSSNQIKQESDALFEATGYPLTGDIPILNRKIFKGTRVNIREHPYIVSVRKKHSHYLTSTLITKNIVLTVAHPLVSVPVHELRIVVGENYSDRGTSLLTVLLLVIHQNFNPYTLDADLAMIRFYEDVIFKTSIKSISLVMPKMSLTDTTGYTTGWGRCDFTEKDLCLPRSSKSYPDEKMDPMLRTVQVNMRLSNLYCEGYARHDVRVGAGMLCTGTAREENPSVACLAVPGAPLVVNGKLAAILSWGFGCGYAHDLPLVYTGIQHYTAWIAQNVKILRKIYKEDLSPLFQATRAYIALEWFSKTRVLKPTFHNHSVYDSVQQLNVDRELAKLYGDLYDIRDFVFGKKFHSKKKLMYEDLRSENQSKINNVNNKIFTKNY